MPSNDGTGGATLGEMIQANDAAATAAAVAALAKPAPAAPIIPASASEAAARKAEILANAEWRDEYLAGSRVHATELRELEKVIGNEKNARVEMAIKGELYDGIQPPGHLTAVGAAKYLQELGLGEAEVRQGLTGAPVSADEHAAAVTTKARLLENSDFVSRYMSGEAEAKRTMTRLNLLISSGPTRSAA